MKVDEFVSRDAVQENTRAILDRMAITDMVYHEFEYTRILVEEIVFHLLNLVSPGGKVVAIGANSLLAQCILEAGYELALYRFGENILASELEAYVCGRVAPESLSSGSPFVEPQSVDAFVLPMVFEHVLASPTVVLGGLIPSLRREGVVIAVTRNLGSLGIRVRTLLGVPALPDLRPPEIPFSMNWPELNGCRFYLLEEVLGAARDAGLLPVSKGYSLGHNSYKRTDFFGIRSYISLMAKHWVKQAIPSLRDYVVLTLRHATAEERRKGLVPLYAIDGRGGHELAQETPFVSVVLPTHNRSNILQDSLNGLLEQTYPTDRFEVLVIDDGSTDDTQVLVEAFKRETPFEVRSYKTAGIGAIGSRNLGMREARGEIVAHLDDDCRPSPEWLEEGVSAFREDVAVVSGMIELKSTHNIPFFSFAPRYDEDRGIYPTANVFYRRKLALEEGGFDPSFGRNLLGRPVSGWDADLAWRLRRKGYRARFSHGAVAYQEVFRLTPKQWLFDAWRAITFPIAVKRVPELGRYLLHRRIFGHWLNLYFDLALLAASLAVVFRNWLPLAFALPWVGWCVRQSPHDRWPPKRWPRLALKIAVLHLRQCITLLALLLGSLRARRLVL